MYGPDERNELITAIQTGIQETRNLAALVRTVAPKLELVKVAGKDEVWYSINRGERYSLGPVNSQTVRDYQYWFTTTVKQSATINTVGNLDAFGPINDDDAPAVASAP